MKKQKPKPKICYMCAVDFSYELGEARGGTTLYGSIEDLKRWRSCVDQCGITKVKVTFEEQVTGSDYSSVEEDTPEKKKERAAHYLKMADMYENVAKNLRKYAVDENNG